MRLYWRCKNLGMESRVGLNEFKVSPDRALRFWHGVPGGICFFFLSRPRDLSLFNDLSPEISLSSTISPKRFLPLFSKISLLRSLSLGISLLRSTLNTFHSLPFQGGELQSKCRHPWVPQKFPDRAVSNRHCRFETILR